MSESNCRLAACCSEGATALSTQVTHDASGGHESKRLIDEDLESRLAGASMHNILVQDLCDLLLEVSPCYGLQLDLSQ